ncbi:hypothetical protein X975_10795, partial [Stegodyphus mimosarum]
MHFVILNSIFVLESSGLFVLRLHDIIRGQQEYYCVSARSSSVEE